MAQTPGLLRCKSSDMLRLPQEPELHWAWEMTALRPERYGVGPLSDDSSRRHLCWLLGQPIFNGVLSVALVTSSGLPPPAFQPKHLRVDIFEESRDSVATSAPHFEKP